jgi:hypothetical protein
MHFPSTKTMDTFYTEESDVEDGDCKIGNSVTNRVTQNVENEEEGAVSTLEAEILEFDSMGLDETLWEMVEMSKSSKNQS